MTGYVDAARVRELVPMADAIEAVRDAFVRLAAGEFEMPTRTVLGNGQFLVMAVRHRPTGTAAVKTLSINPERSPAITGTVTWGAIDSTDALVADASALTALRTGAVVGVATDLLAPPGASTLCLIGSGAQAADQVRAVHEVRPLTDLTIVARTPGSAEVLAAALALPGVAITSETDPDSGVAGREIVCCATSASAPLFSTWALGPEAHVNAIGSFRPAMRELPEDLLASSYVVVDEREAVLEEAGEVIDAVTAGSLHRDDLHELGALLAHGVEREGRTVFKSVGVAVQDWAIARLLAERV